MALTVAFQEGFDHYVASLAAAQPLGFRNTWIEALSTPPSLAYQPGFRGRGHALELTPDVASGRYQRAIPAATQISQHTAIKVTDWDGVNIRPILSWLDFAGNTQFSLFTHPNGTLGLYRDLGATLLATSNYGLTEGVVHRLNLAFDFSNPTSGSADLWIDGNHTNGFTISATDLLASANNTVGMIGLNSQGYGAGINYGHVWQADDLVVCYGAAQNIGELEVITNGPTADVLQQWTRSTGANNYALVDELPPNLDTDYNSSAVAGNIDKQSFPVLPTAPDSIFCVSQIIGARKEEAGTRAIAAVMAGTGADVVGVSQNLTTDYAWYYEHYLTNPDTAAAWLASERAAASFGYKDAL